jgi:hypothetical protein
MAIVSPALPELFPGVGSLTWGPASTATEAEPVKL